MKNTIHTVIIKPGCGFWDVTQSPKGGDFRRCDRFLFVDGCFATEEDNNEQPSEVVGVDYLDRFDRSGNTGASIRVRRVCVLLRNCYSIS